MNRGGAEIRTSLEMIDGTPDVNCVPFCGDVRHIDQCNGLKQNEQRRDGRVSRWQCKQEVVVIFSRQR